MAGEGRKPRTDAGRMLLEKIHGLPYNSGWNLAHQDRQDLLDLLDETLKEARADERAQMSLQFGMVAGEGYRQWRELERRCGEILLVARTSDEVRAALIELVADSEGMGL